MAITEPAHAAHLRNFVESITRGGNQKELNCPAEEAFRTTVTVLKTVEAANLGEKIDLKPEDFEV